MFPKLAVSGFLCVLYLAYIFHGDIKQRKQSDSINFIAKSAYTYIMLMLRNVKGASRDYLKNADRFSGPKIARTTCLATKPIVLLIDLFRIYRVVHKYKTAKNN